jgi:glycosyltransferase involved in cell wall biosynthesis
MDKAAKLVSIVVPFFNEADGIAKFREILCPVLDALRDVRFEVVCVDDGSADRTLAALLDIAAADPRFVVVELSRNFGKEAALTAGLDHALIETMIAQWQAGAEMVLARRADRSADGVLKRKTASWFYSLHNRLSHTKIPENVGDFRLMDRVVVNALKRLPERQRFMKGLFAWVGFRTVTIDYARAERAAGASKFSGFALWNFALEGFTSFSTAPLKIWTYLGAVSALGTLGYAVYIIFRTLVFGISVPGYPSLLVAILFFGSVQLMSIGLLGEYIGRIYVEAKQRPAYLIRKVHGGKFLDGS